MLSLLFRLPCAPYSGTTDGSSYPKSSRSIFQIQIFLNMVFCLSAAHIAPLQLIAVEALSHTDPALWRDHSFPPSKTRYRTYVPRSSMTQCVSCFLPLPKTDEASPVSSHFSVHTLEALTSCFYSSPLCVGTSVLPGVQFVLQDICPHLTNFSDSPLSSSPICCPISRFTRSYRSIYQSLHPDDSSTKMVTPESSIASVILYF